MKLKIEVSCNLIKVQVQSAIFAPLINMMKQNTGFLSKWLGIQPVKVPVARIPTFLKICG